MIKQDKYLREVLKEPPLAAYKRQRNLRDILIKAKVPPAPALRPKRDLLLLGMLERVKKRQQKLRTTWSHHQLCVT